MKGRRSSRSVKLAALARKALLDQLHYLNSMRPFSHDAPLFPSRKFPNRPLSRYQASRILTQAFIGCNLSIGSLGTHTMRKTFARVMFEHLDQNIFKVQKALGHQSPGSTVRYLSFNDEETDQAIETAWPKHLEDFAYETPPALNVVPFDAPRQADLFNQMKG